MNEPAQHTFTYKGGTETCDLSWEYEADEYIVHCLPKEACGFLYGVGVTIDDALQDLDKAYGELMDFATGD